MRARKRASLIAVQPKLTEDQVAALLALEESEATERSPQPRAVSSSADATASPLLLRAMAASTAPQLSLDQQQAAEHKRTERKKPADNLKLQLMRRLGLKPKPTPTATAPPPSATKRRER
jgi:hypothetical protein